MSDHQQISMPSHSASIPGAVEIIFGRLERHTRSEGQFVTEQPGKAAPVIGEFQKPASSLHGFPCGDAICPGKGRIANKLKCKIVIRAIEPLSPDPFVHNRSPEQPNSHVQP